MSEMMTDVGLLLVSALCLAIGWAASRWARRGRLEHALGLGSTRVEPGETITISATVRVPFRPERLVVPSSIAGDFLIHYVWVGRNNQMSSVGAVPASVFSESAEGVRLKMDVAREGATVGLTVFNQSDEVRVFQGGFVGPVAWRLWEIFLTSRATQVRR